MGKRLVRSACIGNAWAGKLSARSQVTKLIRELLPGPDDDPALTCDRGMLTFGALRRRVTAVTCMLFGDNGKRLAFCFLPNSVELVIAYLSAVTGGHIKAGDVLVIRYEGPRGGPGPRWSRPAR